MRFILLARFVLAMSASTGALAAPVTPESCTERLTPATAVPLSHSISARDLIELRDIGSAGYNNDDMPLALSPDGRHVAFQIRRADVAANSYCIGMMVVDVTASHSSRLVDVGGDYIQGHDTFGGHPSDTSAGYILSEAPKWSPDGKWIAYLRRDSGIDQVWRARADGSGAYPITQGSVNSADFWWSAGGGQMLVTQNIGLERSRAAIAREGLRGYRYDTRWLPQDRGTPIPTDTDGPSYQIVDLSDGRAHAASASERALFGVQDPLRPGDARLYARDRSGWSAWTAPDYKADLVAPQRLQARSPTGAIIPCRGDACTGIYGDLWWSNDQKNLYYLHREGWALGQTALYRWQPGTDRRTRLFQTDALIVGCRKSGETLVCASEDAITPRSLIIIDLRSGKIRPLYDPNPEFRAVQLGSVQRLRWKNDIGLEAYGDLVLPPGHVAGEKHPLIIVQYFSRGFLRGGTGDAYPIQLFAAHGYAVLSLQRPMRYAFLHPAYSEADLDRSEAHGEDNRSAFSAIEIGVGRAVATGDIDAGQIAITGLSDGAYQTRYALLHSSMFKAAEVSSCCDDPISGAVMGEAASRDRLAGGIPPIGAKAPQYWSNYSFLEHPEAFNTPLLIQGADREYLRAIATVDRLQQLGKPVELFVFPNEHHTLWQPAHRLAMYQRDIDWFDVWVRGRTPDTSSDPDRTAEIARWIDQRSRLARLSPQTAASPGASSLAPRPPRPKVEAAAGLLSSP